MVRTNSLGSIVEPTKNAQPSSVTKPNDFVISVNMKSTDRIRSSYSSILCCMITTTLVATGVGIAIWYSVTEIS